MSRLFVLGACGMAVLFLTVEARQAPPQTTFRAGVDLVDVDVSVLDRNRLPVRGLTADDFTVYEDGKVRPIAAFSAVDLPTRERPSAPWLAEIAPDVVANEFPREGRLVVILMDRSIGPEHGKTAVDFAEAAVDQLRPGDMAAVAYSTFGVPQNFTADRALLLAAIRQPTSRRPAGDSGSPAECFCGACSLETITGIAEAMAPIRQRRKVLLFVGTNLSIQSRSATCGGVIGSLRGRAIRALQAGNITVHTFDPSGVETLMDDASMQTPSSSRMRMAALQRRGNVAILPDETGGRVVRDSFRPADHVASLLRESTSYYVLGFVPTAPATSRRFHEISVKVDRRDVKLQARRGYYGPAATLKEVVPRKTIGGFPPVLRAAIEGLWPRTDVQMAITAVPFAGPRLDVATVASVVSATQVFDGPGPLFESPVPTTVHVLVGAFDRRGEALATARQTVSLTPRQARARQFEYEVLSHFDLGPGRYEIRAAVEDTALGRSGSVYTYVDVPDYRQAPVELSGVLMAAPGRVSAPPEALSALVSFVPTARRTFTRSERATAFVRVYQGLTRSLTPGYVTARIVDEHDAVVFQQESRVLAEQFGAGRALDFSLDLPLDRLADGEFLLTLEARSGTAQARRDARFRVVP
jgi:VWFA-related protein